MRRSEIMVFAAVMAALVAFIIWSGRRSASSPQPGASSSLPLAAPAPTRPKEPPRPGDPRPHVVEPKSPVLTQEWKAELTEKVRGEVRPGEAAFAAYADRFVDENLELAEEQAKAEHLTLPEVRALTRLGLLVMATQRIPEVEEVLGHELSPAAKAALEALVQHENGAFTSKMRELVARGGTEAQRWALIHDADARYREEFGKVSGMTAELLDDLLAGNLLLPGAPAANPDPATVGMPEGSGAERQGPRDTIAVPPRPTSAPR
jgi:hypothetical protein